MHDNAHEKSHNKREQEGNPIPIHPLKSLSEAEFAALGAHSVVYAREIDAAELSKILPGNDIDPDAGTLELLMSADGTPVLVTDSQDALFAWLDDKPVELATVH